MTDQPMAAYCGKLEDEIERLRTINAELLEALKEYVRDFGDNEDSDSWLMADKARAVIAKAEAKP